MMLRRLLLTLIAFLSTPFLCVATEEAEITFVTMQLRPTFDEYFFDIFRRFEEQHPGTRIIWKDVPFEGYETKLMLSLGQPHAPDVVNLPSESIERYINAQYLEPFDEHLAPEVFASYVPKLLEDGGVYHGSTYALPWYAVVNVTFMNREIFAQAGLDDTAPPLYNEDLPEISRIIREKTGKFAIFPLYTEAATLRTYLVEANVPLLNDDGTRAIFHTPRGVEVFKFWTDLYRDGLVPSEALTAIHRHPVEQYKTGNLALLTTGPQFVRQIKADAPEIYEKTTVGPMPHWKDNGAHTVALHTLVLSSNSRHPRLAAEFAAFVTNAENQLNFTKLAVIVPSTLESLEHPRFSQSDGTLEGDARVISANLVKTGIVYRPPRETGKLYRIMEQVTEDVALGKINADEGLRLAEEEWTKILSAPVREGQRDPGQAVPLAVLIAFGIVVVIAAARWSFRVGATQRRQARLAYLFLLPTLAILVTFQFYPVLNAFYLSFWDYSLIMPGQGAFIGVDNFLRLAHDSNFWSALKNSALYLAVVPAMIVLSLALAMLVEPRIPFIGFFRAAYYVPVVTMMVVVAYAWSLIFSTENGVLNQALARIGARDNPIGWLTDERIALWTVMTVTLWKGLGYYMVMFIVGLKSVPRELTEASRIDGANAWQSFRNVTLPNLWPVISLVGLISSISALQVFDEIYMMTHGRIDTTTLVYEIYRTGFEVQGGSNLDMGYACAMGVVLFAILIVFSALAVRTMDRVYST